jgi:hypothetical protein
MKKLIYSKLIHYLLGYRIARAYWRFQLWSVLWLILKHEGNWIQARVLVAAYEELAEVWAS